MKRLQWRRTRDHDAAGLVKSGPPIVVTVSPEEGKRLAEGVVVEASVLARVLGVRLLRLDAEVVIAPAQVRPPAVAPPPGRPAGVSYGARSALPAARHGPIGGGLPEAMRTVEEAAELLADTRRNGTPR